MSEIEIKKIGKKFTVTDGVTTEEMDTESEAKLKALSMACDAAGNESVTEIMAKK